MWIHLEFETYWASVCLFRRRGHSDPEHRKRRAIANSNERKRMQSINAGFNSLRNLVCPKSGDKLSKVSDFAVHCRCSILAAVNVMKAIHNYVITSFYLNGCIVFTKLIQSCLCMIVRQFHGWWMGCFGCWSICQWCISWINPNAFIVWFFNQTWRFNQISCFVWCRQPYWSIQQTS